MTDDEYADFYNKTRQAVKAVDGFIGAMRAEGIHIGVGAKPYCACCGDPWPCSASINPTTEQKADGNR